MAVGPSRPYQLAFAGPGRPTQLARMIELSKMAWSPVLELLGKEVRFEELDAKPYPIRERVRPSMFPGAQRLIGQPPGPADARIRWLTSTDIVRVHDDMIRTFGGELGIINRGRIDTALDLAFQSPIAGHNPFPSIIEKAASLLHSILVYHPFVDGQKRTGISCAFILLGVNGFFMWSRNAADEVHFAIHCAKAEFEVDQISRWIAARVAPPQILEEPTVVTALLPFAERRTRACTRCHHAIRIDAYRVKCPSCGVTYVATLNGGIVQRQRGQNRFYVQAGLRLERRRPWGQRTLEDYLLRPEGSRLRLGRPQRLS